MVFLLLFTYFIREPLPSLIGGGEELKWCQLTHHQLMSQIDLIIVHTVNRNPMIQVQISGRMVSSGMSEVAIASVYSEKTRLKKLMIIIIIITSNRKRIY